MLGAHDAVESALEWRAHPDVWLLMGGLLAAYFGALRYLGPRLAASGRPVATEAQKLLFTAGVVVLWIGADWPSHELSEDFLFTAHMVQHTLFSLVAPPLLLLGLPPWLMRAALRGPKTLRVARFLTRPLVALAAFNGVIVVTHWPALVDFSLGTEWAHFLVHVVLVASALMMWWPVVSPLPELARLTEPAKMLYLFLQSIVPTVPASFLTFSDKVFYETYAAAPRLWGISAISDQRVAGLIMKIVGGLLLWLAIAIIFFRWNAKEEAGEPDTIAWDDFERELEAWELRR